jgi:hypothetical protein
LVEIYVLITDIHYKSGNDFVDSASPI